MIVILLKRFKILATVAFASVFFLPNSLASQSDGYNQEDVVSLLQLEIPYDVERAPEFLRQTRKVRSCDQAREAAQNLNAKVVEKQSVSIKSLPTDVADIISEVPIGYATVPFGRPGGTIRVLFVCDRNGVTSQDLLNITSLTGPELPL